MGLSGDTDKLKSLSLLGKTEYLACVEADGFIAEVRVYDQIIVSQCSVYSRTEEVFLRIVVSRKSLVHHGDTESTEEEGFFCFAGRYRQNNILSQMHRRQDFNMEACLIPEGVGFMIQSLASNVFLWSNCGGLFENRRLPILKKITFPLCPPCLCGEID